MNTTWTNSLPFFSNPLQKIRLFALTLVFAATAFSFASATTWYTLNDGNYNNTSDVWSLDGHTACGCAPGANVAGPYDTINVRHKVTLTSNVRLGGFSEFFIDQGARVEGQFDFILSNANLTNRGSISIRNINLRVSSHFYAINLADLSGNLICDEARVELSGTLNIAGNVYNRNDGYIQIFSNATMYVDGFYNNDGVTDIQPGSCVNLVADFTNPITGSVTGGGYVRSFSNISNVGFWDPNVSWCADGAGTGLPTPPNCVNCGALPVVLAAFDAAYKPENRKVELSWTTVYELNNDFFTLERSEDGTNYTTLGQVSAYENAANGAKYTSVDEEPLSGNAFYRLRQTDDDGSSKVLAVVQVNTTDPGRISAHLYPNPFSDRIQFSVGGGDTERLDPIGFTVTDLSGRTVLVHTIENEMAYHHGELEMGHLPSGTYLVQIRSGNFREVVKVVKR